MRRLYVIPLLLLLAACASRASVVVYPQAVMPADVERIFVGTTRAPSDDGQFDGGRSKNLSFASFDISIPPDRGKGGVTFAKRGQANPEVDFMAIGRQDFAAEDSFKTALSHAIRASASPGEVILFVHGFNNTLGDGVLRMAQLSRDFDFKGVSVHFAWPSAASALGYEYDRDSQLTARDGLERLIRLVHAAGGRKIVLVAHSMGAMLSMESMRQMEIATPGAAADYVEGVILISPDIDIDVFRSQVTRFNALPDPFAIFVSRKDRALLVSAFITGQSQRLGNLISAEEVADLHVTLIDVTNLSSGLGHFTVGNSPALIKLLNQAGQLDAAFRGGTAEKTGLLPGVIITVRSATELVLAPIKPLAQ